MKRLSKLTLGTAQLGLNYGIANTAGKPTLDKSFKMLDAAIDNGINSFDTAAGYGDSEIILGKYFANNKEALKSAVITTKIVLGSDTVLTKDQVEVMVSEKVQQSLERLQCDHIDNLMLHDPTDLLKHKDNIVSALGKVKDKGYAKSIGISLYSTEQIKEALTYKELKCVQLPINIIDVRLIRDKMLDALKNNSFKIYARSVFLQGLFFMKPENLPERIAGAKVYLEKIRHICEKLNMSIAELAFGYVRDLKEIDSLVVGAETPAQIEANVKLLNGPKIPDEYIKEINECFAQVPELYLEPWRWERDDF